MVAPEFAMLEDVVLARALRELGGLGLETVEIEIFINELHVQLICHANLTVDN